MSFGESLHPYLFNPSCVNCNKNKLDAVLNPYYEDSDSVIWLSTALFKDAISDFLTMAFYVSPPDDCDTILQARLKNQFVLFHLNDLYSKHAAEEMIAVVNRHSRIYKVAGRAGVEESIQESVVENEYRPNS